MKFVIGGAVAIAKTDRNVFCGNDGEDTETGHGNNEMAVEDAAVVMSVGLLSSNFKF